MPLNSYFLHGSTNEQFLVQDLINEQIKMYGVEVYYLPRKLLKTDDIIKEIQSSKFDDTFLIEAYVNNYEGYAPDHDVMTKFGLKLNNEISLTISKEKFEDFITPFLEGISAGIREGRITGFTFGDLVSRPKEGDLIYFPLGERLFEIKRVEGEKPFYQLGTLYTFELSCELYEYENELIDTSIDAVDDTVEDEGYLSTVNLVGIGKSAAAIAGIGGTGMIGKIYLNNDGYNYSSTPTVTVSTPDVGLNTCTAVAITTSIANLQSIKEILIINPGSGYTGSAPPTVTITGGGGAGAAATALVVDNGLSGLAYNPTGTGYWSVPTVTIDGPSVGTTAIVRPTIADGSINGTHIINAGAGYTTPPTIGISSDGVTGIGTFVYNELVTGQSSGTQARVRDYKILTNISTLDPPKLIRVALNTGLFWTGETIVGSISSARYIVKSYDTDSYDNPYDSNEIIEETADSIVDFSESNPFGDF